MSRVRIKFCGLTRAEDVDRAVECGVDALGFNFYAPSPRSILPEQTAALLARVPALVEPVAVCVSPDPKWLAERLRPLTRLRSLQYHGETVPTPQEVGWPLIPAFRVRDVASVQAIGAYLSRCGEQLPLAVLVDAHVAGLHGGTGQTAPWELLAGLQLAVPLILAGGLTPDNVAEAVRQVRPYAVDTASGIESAPGIKDAGKMRAFVAAVQSS